MEIWQKAVLLVYGLVNFFVFVRGFYECKIKKNAYGLTPSLLILGIFAWGDAVIFGPFWTGSVIVSYFLKDWNLFLLIVSVFWVVRSLGETIYWLNQQFSTVDRNPPKRLSWYSIFQNDSVWYAHQIKWQCVTVISIIFSIYFAKIWLQGRL